METRINADDEYLGTPRDIRRAERSLKVLFKYTAINEFKEPCLDVGSGESFMRNLFIKNTGIQVLHSEVDLDVTPYDFPDNYFKTITSFEVLEHLFNPLYHLMELKRILAPDGNIYITTPNDYSLIYKAEHLLNRKYRPHFHQFSKRDLRDIFNRAGFKIILLKKYFKSRSGTIARISRNGFLIHLRK